ncbi:MAG: AAA family ATPase [Anaeromicrobium sp.]|jgi:MoxR-like ATPase|uniref:McrB family protein n=1 Tax=Anaeromicrobium sp. TaxID=1929132 RepID=UPI0025D0487F|nr:AAA family ATPase [Anaeromicrobium sp.]MCT4592791.1 AAA family ATPase [Anaeromicrobium sp.]
MSENRKLIFIKNIDTSFFRYGLTIPKEYRYSILKILPDENLESNKSIQITLDFEGETFLVRLRETGRSKYVEENLQIIHSGSKDISDYLKRRFTIVWNEIEKVPKGKKYNVPSELMSGIKIYATGKEKYLYAKEIEPVQREFFDFVGPANQLEKGKYKKSYKLVLLLKMLQIADEKGHGDYNELCERIRLFYINREYKEVVIEESDSDILKNINNLTLEKVKTLMSGNPYKAYNNKGFLIKENINNKETLKFNEELWSSIDNQDIEDLKSILMSKLDIYYKERLESNMIKDEIPSKEIINHVHKYITSKGFSYDKNTIKNLYLSLKTKPFVLLAGISGTGKSKLVKLFAESLGANSENGRYTLIPVRPDWSDPSDLLGYKNIEDKFQVGPLTKIIKEAQGKDEPYFVCLDEMNLARVEYYFSDILSVMETRYKDRDMVLTDKLLRKEVFGQDKNSYVEYGNLTIPENLYIIGTVNMDETTFPFSKKVLDRANTIEFNEVDLKVDFNNLRDDYEVPRLLINKEMVSEFIGIKDVYEYKEIAIKVIESIEKINECLKENGLHFAYRVRDEIIFYVTYAVKNQIMDMEEALDYCIMQKVLPRLQGSTTSIKYILIDIFKVLTEFEGKIDKHDNNVWQKMNKHMKGTNNYKNSGNKIVQMVRRFERDGFTTFWQ